MKKLLIKILSKNKTVKKVAKILWDFFRMHIFEIVHVHTYDPHMNVKRIYLFGKVVNHYHKKSRSHNKHVFYFKINRDNEYALMCIQHWINSINQLNQKYEFFFVCDNPLLERKIVRFVCFKDGQINFIPSMHKGIKKIAENLYTGHWKNATYAHLTPFYHAKKHGYKNYWTIDGDDTMFCIAPQKVSHVINKVEKKAEANNISAMSLDMWRSRTHGKHWSLGVVYIRDSVDFCHFFEQNTNLNWTQHYKSWDVAFNVDWFFNYLKDYKKIKIETFYVDNCYFIHWGDFFRNIIGSSICYWHKKRIVYPILTGVLDNKALGNLNIAKEVIKIRLNLDLTEGVSFLENEISLIRNFPTELKRLHSINNFGQATKYYY